MPTSQHMDPTALLEEALAAQLLVAKVAIQMAKVVRLMLAAVNVHRELPAAAVDPTMTGGGHPSAARHGKKREVCPNGVGTKEGMEEL